MTARACPAPTCRPVTLDRDAIERLLPHRPPVLLLQRVPWLVPGESGVGVACDLREAAPAVPRCEAQGPPWPLLVEAVAQLAAIVAISERYWEGSALALPAEPQSGFLASLHELEVAAVGPVGPAVTLEASLTGWRGRLAVARGRAFVGARCCLEGRWVLGLGD